MTEEELKSLKELCERATPGPGEILHSKHIAEPGMKEEILASISASINKSIAHDGGHPWVWIEVKDRIKVGDFGCGPTSMTNALLWGAAREALPKLIKEVERLQSERQCTLGVGDGSGDLFVFGKYEAIKRAQEIILERDSLKADLELYTSNLVRTLVEYARLKAEVEGLQAELEKQKAIYEQLAQLNNKVLEERDQLQAEVERLDDGSNGIAYQTILEKERNALRARVDTLEKAIKSAIAVRFWNISELLKHNKACEILAEALAEDDKEDRTARYHVGAGFIEKWEKADEEGTAHDP